MGPLANLFSTIDSAKRKFGGLLENPMGTFEQLMGQMQDYRRQDQQLGDQAFGDPKKGEPLVKDRQAFAQLGQRTFDNLMSFAPAGITVWHGSPHTFSKFDSSKIGTGEGAQAYGHGLYLAESPDVAKSYQTSLAADRGFSYGGKSGLTRQEVQDMVNAKYGGGYLDGVLRPSGVADSFIDDMVTGLNRADGAYPRQYKPGSQRAKLYDELRGQILHADPGSLYKVDLPDEHVAKMLDWDKPITKQLPLIEGAARKAALKQAREDALPLAQKRLPPTESTGDWLTDLFGDAATAPANQKLLDDLVTEEVGKMNLDNYFKRQMDAIIGPTWTTEMSGQQLYKNLSTNGGAPGAAKFLSDAGIPGIRYWDGGSRAIESGTHNFVIFPGNEGLLTILERNGQPLR